MDSQDTKKILSQFLKSDKYCYYDDNGQFEGIYQSAIIEDNPFDKDKKRIVFTFICSDGKARTLNVSSKRFVAEWMKAEVNEGDLVRITRVGVKFNVQFSIRVLQTKAQLLGLANEQNNPTVTSEVNPEDVPF